MKILVCDELSPAGLKKLRAIAGAQVEVRTGLKEAELVRAVPAYEALVVRSGVRITAAVIEAARELKVVVRAGTGYDNIDLPAATRRGVAVMNTPGGSAVTTAEHAVAMLLALARNLPQAHASLKGGKWDRKSFVGTELAGKCLGIVGLGNVGRLVAARARGLKMEVVAHDPFVPESAAADAGAASVTAEELYRRADFVTLHAVLSDATRGMIGRGAIARMKQGVRIVNCARGELVDEEALLEALESGRVAGAALDVFAREPPPAGDRLVGHPNVICTPHLGASTAEAQEQVVTAAVEQLRAFILEGIVLNGVNVPSVGRDVLAALGKYIALAGRLGSLLGQIGPAPAEEVRVECAGEITKHDTAPIGTAALCGVLEAFSEGPVNFVSAPEAAKERGIRLVEARAKEAGDYLSLVTVSVRSGSRSHLAAGSVFGRRHGRLVRLDDFFLEVIPEGHILVLRNEDRPGIVGSWGTVLGRNGINISQMQVALDRTRGEALSIVNVDTPVPGPILEELKAVPGIVRVSQVRL